MIWSILCVGRDGDGHIGYWQLEPGTWIVLALKEKCVLNRVIYINTSRWKIFFDSNFKCVFVTIFNLLYMDTCEYIISFSLHVNLPLYECAIVMMLCYEA